MAAPEPIPYYPPQAPLDPHMRTSDGLLAAAAAILERPDAEIDGELRAQACEKLWGAAACRLQVFADARGWYYCEHSVASRLVVQIGEALDADSSELIANFDSAERLHHKGFCEDTMDLTEIRHRMRNVLSLCAMLDEAHRRLPLDLEPPDNRHYRRAAQRCAERRRLRAAASAD